VPRLATGGIIQRPTLVLAGEAGPEAIVPLPPRTRDMLSGDVHVHIHGGVFMADERDAISLAERLANVLQQRLRTAGSVGLLA